MNNDENKVCGKTIQVDLSGQGHCWREAESLPASVREEIEGEIIDGRNQSVDDFTAGNGRHYRW